MEIKNFYSFQLTILFFILISSCFRNNYSFYIQTGAHKNITLNNFAFGSCFNSWISDRFDIFKTIHNNNPELWIWLGDAAYVDVTTLLYYWRSSLEVNFTLANEKFKNSKSNEYYSSLEKEIPTLGIWDDHDYALNNGNGYYSDKETIKKIYLDFLGEPIDSLRRTLGKGIYTSYSFGDISTHKTVRIILLDVRFNKSSWYYDYHDADMLGTEQWNWLEREISSNNETFTFIGSGTQILPFNRFVSEAWFYNSRKKLFSLISKYKKSGVIFLSGDIHCAQILKTFCVLPEIGYDLYEITSSGLSHYVVGSYLFDKLLPDGYSIIPTVDSYNFAKIDLIYGDDKESSKVAISIIDADDKLRAQITLPYTKLKFNSTLINDPECSEKINSPFKSITEYFSYYKDNPFSMIFLIPFLLFVFILYSILFYLPYWILKNLFAILKFALNKNKIKKE